MFISKITCWDPPGPLASLMRLITYSELATRPLIEGGSLSDVFRIRLWPYIYLSSPRHLPFPWTVQLKS